MDDGERHTEDEAPIAYEAPAVQVRTTVGDPLIMVVSSPVVC